MTKYFSEKPFSTSLQVDNTSEVHAPRRRDRGATTNGMTNFPTYEGIPSLFYYENYTVRVDYHENKLSILQNL